MNGDCVVDTSVLIQAFIRDSETARARSVVNQILLNAAFRVHTVEFTLVECANVLWKQTRFHGVDRAGVRQSLTNILALPLIVEPLANVLPSALVIAMDSGLAVYDSVQIALAQRLQLPLLTVDRKQAEIAASLGVTLKPLSDFPEYSKSEGT